MYIITDTVEIANTIDNKAPRDVETILREIYPDCVVDRNGRAHAPCDGYYSDYTGMVYRGGEYLPESEEAVAGASQKMMQCVDVATNKVVIFEGTSTQIKAAREIAKRQQNDFDTKSSFVGEVKKREVLALRVFAVFSNFTEFGPSHTHYMRDEAMNPVIYKGSKILGNAGTDVTIKATVKSHWSAGDRKATYIARPAFV